MRSVNIVIFRAPVHITTGSAGCREKHDGFLPNPPEWSAVRCDHQNYQGVIMNEEGDAVEFSPRNSRKVWSSEKKEVIDI